MPGEKTQMWTPVVTDDCDWTQVGDPVKRRQIQNRISKRRQRERARQQKAKAKEAAASLVHDSSPIRRWRCYSSPPGTFNCPDWQVRPSIYDESPYADRPRDMSSFGCLNGNHSAVNSGSPSYSTPSSSYWSQASLPPFYQPQFPPTPHTDFSRSPTHSRQTPASEPVQQLPWPSEEVQERALGPDNAGVPQERDSNFEEPHPPWSTHHSADSFFFSHCDSTNQSTTTAGTSEERLNPVVTYSQAMGYPPFESAVADV
ncbi:MAG: hypothetical protein Q9159_007202 [Coniocarpon cinnabarinum]